METADDNKDFVPTLCLGHPEQEATKAIDATRLFPKTHMTICLRRERYLRNYPADFITLLTPGRMRNAIHPALMY